MTADDARGAAAAAAACAADLGLPRGEPEVLRATNHAVFWLRPSAVVAKVGRGDGADLARELRAAAALAASGAPVLGPAPGLPAAVHRRGGFAVTLWPHLPQAPDAEADDAAVAAALAALHRALDRIDLGPEFWPPWDGEIPALHARLGDPAFAPALAAADRDLLRRALDRGRARLRHLGAHDRRLHGAPHGLNVLLRGGAPLFIDFESLCRGPLEWDLAHQGEAVAAAYPGPLRAEALRACRLLCSARTAAWCWDGLESGPDMPWHAEHHLNQVREAAP